MVLAGTADAKELCGRLSRMEGVEAVASLSGATSAPARYEIPVRAGGFGGADGLADELRRGGYTHLVDATHPFALRITANARSAAALAGARLARLERPPWLNGRDGAWTSFPDLPSAITALPGGSRVFATIGSGIFRSPERAFLEIRNDCRFIVRVAEPVDDKALPGNCRAVAARPAGDPEKELAALEKYAATCLLCRNSGGRAGLSKLRAAARIGIPVHMVERRAEANATECGDVFVTAREVERWIMRDPTA